MTGSLIELEPGHFNRWDEGNNFTGIKDEEEEATDQNSIQTDNSFNVADRLMNKEEKLSNLYDSLLEAGNFVQALTAGGEIKDAQENQHITGCMTGLANALLNQPYRILIDQQTELLKAIQQINNSVANLVKKVDNNEKTVEQFCEEALYNTTAMAEQLKAINSMATDTQTHISTLEEKTMFSKTRSTDIPQNMNHNNTYATRPTYKPKGKPDTNQGMPKPNPNPLTAHHPCHAVICFLPDGIKEGEHLKPTLVVDKINGTLANSQSLKARHMKVIAATYNNQGNLIISTHADQRVSDLLQYTKDFLFHINQGFETSALEDK